MIATADTASNALREPVTSHRRAACLRKENPFRLMRHSTLEHIAMSVQLGSYSPNNIVTLCSAYLDASGKLQRGNAAMTVAGFAAPVKKWIRFEREWQAALDAEGVNIFHATDFASCQGEFNAWRGQTVRRGKFVSALINIIKKNTNKLLSIGVEIDAWNDVNQTYELEESFHSPYALAGYAAVLLASKWAHRKGYKYPVEAFFEDGDEDQRGLKALCKRHHGMEVIFQSKAKVIPFQAADMIAWKQMNAMRNLLRLESEMQANPDVQTFESMLREWDSMRKAAPNSGEFMVFGKARLVQNCVENGIPKRRPLVMR
jgi:hypothetical protein